MGELRDSLRPADELDPRLASALEVQLDRWREALGAGAVRVGWKLGVGDAERIGGEIAVGHLTTATLLPPGATFDGRGEAMLSADAEVALLIGRDVAPDADAGSARRAIAGYAAAVELVDLANASDGPEAVVAANVFHRAVAFSTPWRTMPASGVEGRLIINGEVRAAAPAALDFADRVCATARLLGAVGQQLQAGDRVITGSVVQVGIERGDDVIADVGVLGRVGVAVAP
jgi:2-keto-4-pentenoate hydratase